MAASDVKPVDLEAAARATGLSLSELQLLREHKDQVTELLEQLKKADDKARSQAERVGGSSVPAGSRQLSERSFRREGVQGLEDDSRQRRGPIVSPDSSRDRVATGIRERQELRPPQPRFQAVPAARSEAKDSVARTFLQEEYGGRCQICGFTFAKTNGQPYFEGLYLAPGLRGQWLDRPGNVLCLCANCCAKMQFGAIDNEIILGQFRGLDVHHRGSATAEIQFRLADRDVSLTFTERHLVDLQKMLRAESSARVGPQVARTQIEGAVSGRPMTTAGPHSHPTVSKPTVSDEDESAGRRQEGPKLSRAPIQTVSLKPERNPRGLPPPSPATLVERESVQALSTEVLGHPEPTPVVSTIPEGDVNVVLAAMCQALASILTKSFADYKDGLQGALADQDWADRGGSERSPRHMTELINDPRIVLGLMLTHPQRFRSGGLSSQDRRKLIHQIRDGLQVGGAASHRQISAEKLRRLAVALYRDLGLDAAMTVQGISLLPAVPGGPVGPSVTQARSSPRPVQSPAGSGRGFFHRVAEVRAEERRPNQGKWSGGRKRKTKKGRGPKHRNLSANRVASDKSRRSEDIHPELRKLEKLLDR